MSFVDKDSAAEFLGVSPRTIEKWTQQKQIPHYKVSHRCIRYDVAELAEWMKEAYVPAKDGAA
jgi:excisionase family DNA binding protein